MPEGQAAPEGENCKGRYRVQEGLIPVNSVTFEYVYVANQRCECGGYFATVSQELHISPSGPVDRLKARCESCGVERTFDFDISSFFGQLEKYGHFRLVDDCFRQAMLHLRAGRLGEAEAALRRVVDPEEGEPAFAWGYYHLGMVLLYQNRPEEALPYLERASALQPLEPDIHEGVGRAYQAAGFGREAEDRFRLVEKLRTRFDLSPSSGGGQQG